MSIERYENCTDCCGDGSVQTDCCGNPTPRILHVDITLGESGTGEGEIEYQDGSDQWEGAAVVGPCSEEEDEMLDLLITLECTSTSIGGWILTIVGCDNAQDLVINAEASSCDPLHLVFDPGVLQQSCCDGLPINQVQITESF